MFDRLSDQNLLLSDSTIPPVRDYSSSPPQDVFGVGQAGPPLGPGRAGDSGRWGRGAGQDPAPSCWARAGRRSPDIFGIV